MYETLAIVFPVFGVILLGFIASRVKLLSDMGVDALMRFVWYLAIPALLFRAVARIETPDVFDPGLLFGYYSAAFAVWAMAMAIARFVYRHAFEEQVLFGMTSVYGNNVMLGIALILTAFGDRGVVPMMLIIALHPTLLMSLPTILIEASRGRASGGGRFRGWVLAPAKALVTNPIIMSMVAGAVWAVTGWSLPDVADRTIELVGRPATPVALFALGASLTRFKLGGDLGQVAVVVAIKLLVLPAAVWIATAEVFGVDRFSATIAALLAAMPSGTTVFVLANSYQVFTARAAAAVLASTALAWITVAILIGYFT